MLKLFSLLLNFQLEHKASRWTLFFFLFLGSFVAVKPANASNAQTAPVDLKNLLTQIDAAATKGDIKTVMQFYSPNFTHGDGLTRQSMQEALTGLWQRYPRLRYTTQIESWKSEGNIIVTETLTNITGLPSGNSNNLAMNSSIRSSQRITGGKILSQQVISEKTLLTGGIKPPQVDFKVPQQVRIGQRYNVDAIVQEPLGDDYLLGAAVEEPIEVSKYIKPSPVNLQLLTSGGIFKVGKAPDTPGSHWISAVIIRGDGMVMITQRMNVVAK
jgi:hypothetical protein